MTLKIQLLSCGHHAFFLWQLLFCDECRVEGRVRHWGSRKLMQSSTEERDHSRFRRTAIISTIAFPVNSRRSSFPLSLSRNSIADLPSVLTKDSTWRILLLRVFSFPSLLVFSHPSFISSTFFFTQRKIAVSMTARLRLGWVQPLPNRSVSSVCSLPLPDKQRLIGKKETARQPLEHDSNRPCMHEIGLPWEGRLISFWENFGGAAVASAGNHSYTRGSWLFMVLSRC